MNSTTHPRFACAPAREQLGQGAGRYPVVVCGAGPVGLTAALGLGRRGIPTLVLEKDETYSVGSRAICWSERTLDIWSRLGCVRPVLERGVTWEVGKVFLGDRLIQRFDLRPPLRHKHPPFRNLQQYYVEGILAASLAALGNSELRWGHRLKAVEPREDGVHLIIGTPHGDYSIAADYLIAADGAQSTVREILGLCSQGTTFRQPFLIIDAKVQASFPNERLFWFDPPFHSGRSALLHRQAGDVVRIDLQLQGDEDFEQERRPERVQSRLRAMLGPDQPFEVEWTSIYTFQCRRLPRFRHGRVLFAGDAAHQLSPFGARGGNGGVQDADNLAWKLALVLQGLAPDALLDSYCQERTLAADVDIQAASRSNHFITPQTAASLSFRDAVLALSRSEAFARQLVNSGRMSAPARLDGSPLNTPDCDDFPEAMAPGSPFPNLLLSGAEEEPRGLCDEAGDGFFALCFAGTPRDVPAETRCALAAMARLPVPLRSALVVAGGGSRQGEERDGLRVLADRGGELHEAFGAEPGTVYLLRGDGYVAARWRSFDAAASGHALERATGRRLRGEERTSRRKKKAVSEQRRAPGIAGPDGFYESLVQMHQDLNEEQSRLLMAKLIVLLAHQIGDFEVLGDLLAKAVQA